MLTRSDEPEAMTEDDDDIYRYHTRLLYKIWFSSTTDHFLGLENELRIIRMRHQNPQAVIHLVCNLHYLDDITRAKLAAFCERHKIELTDIDSIKSWPLDEDESELYAIALEELTRAQNQTGGNLAAASDCIRLLIPVIEKLGIYTDFDVKCHLSHMQAKYFTTSAPMLFNGHTINQGGMCSLDVNTDFLACGYENNDGVFTLSSVAVTEIKRIQRAVIAKYRSEFNIQTLQVSRGMMNEAVSQFEENTFNEFKLKGTEKTVFEFRVFLNQLKQVYLDKNDAVSANAVDALYKKSVIHMSGPANFQQVYSVLRGVSIDGYAELFKASCVSQYPELVKGVNVSNSVLTGANSSSADHSWTASGLLNKQVREQMMMGTAGRMLLFYRARKSLKHTTEKLNDKIRSGSCL